MPIYDIQCRECRFSGEVLAATAAEMLACPDCGSVNTEKVMSPTSSLTGKSSPSYPSQAKDACCGRTPSQAGCAGPGSCCGKSF